MKKHAAAISFSVFLKTSFPLLLVSAVWPAQASDARSASKAPDGQASLTVIRDVTVLPMDREIALPHQTVLVKNGMIVAVRAATAYRVPPGATVIDGKGRFLLPGLVDFHTHPRGDTELAAFRHYGVTRVVALGGEPLGWSAEAKASLQAGLPSVMASTRPIDGMPPISKRFYPLDNGQWAAAALNSEQAQGASLVKVYSKLSPAVLQDVAQQAHKLGMPVIGHTPWDSKPADVLQGQIDIVAHGEELFQYLGEQPSDAQIAALLEGMHHYGVALVPNIVAYRAMAEHAYHLQQVLQDEQVTLLSATSFQDWQPRSDSYANRQDLDQFDTRMTKGMALLKRISLAAERASVPLLSGTDAPAFAFPGSSLLDEVELLVQGGLSNYQALRSATANAGQVLKRFPRLASNFDTIQTGQQADMVLLTSNPLQDLATLRQPQGVMVGGRWYSSVDLAKEEAVARADALHAHQIVQHYEDLIAKGRGEELVAWLQSLPVGRFPDLHIAVVAGDVAKLADEGQPALALKLWSAAHPHMVISPAYYTQLGDLRQKLGDTDAARSAYEQALAMMPGHAGALEALAGLHPKGQAAQ